MESAIAHFIADGEQRTSDVAAGSISFEELHLHGDILKGLRSHRFLTPTKIQAAAIPMVLAGMDLLVQSKSGTGKTLIYVLAALQMIQKAVAKPQVLIIVPTRELAIQVEDTANGLSHNTHNRKNYLSISYIGGTDVTKDRTRMAKTRIAVGTPGRLMHLIQNKVFNTSAIKLVVLDEVDQLYATESLKRDVQALVESLPKCQIIACSATYPDGLDDRLAKLMNNPILVSNSERATVLLGIRQFVYELPEQVNSMQEMMAKLAALHKIIGQISYEQSILFASSQSRADSFCNYLHRDGVECELMSGAMKQIDRIETFQAYRNFKMRTMVATDLMARGVDSSHANLIINLDIPKDLVTYLHRIGRAGRFGSKGIAITFVSSPQQSQKFRRLIAEAGTGMSVFQFPTEKREGLDFWDYDSYDFPYFAKAESHEQEECELKRIKQRWKSPTEQTSEKVKESQKSETYVAPGDTPQKTVEQLKQPKYTEELETRQADESKQKLAEEIVQNEVDIISQQPAKGDAKQSVNHEQPLNSLIEHPTLQTIKGNHKMNIVPKEPKVNKTEKLLQEKTELNKPLELQEAPMETIELTPSIEDLPAAAPNSINTKTYCLMPPTERSSTTLLPQGISNTVDDASSIISDSMDNAYDSDASYNSYYSLSDAHLIWQRALAQRKVQKKRQGNPRRRICIYNRGCCNILNCTGASQVKRTKNPNGLNVEDSSDVSTLKFDNELTGYFESKTNNQIPLICKRFDRLRLLKKFENMQEIQNLLNNYIKRVHVFPEETDEWLDQLYDAMQDLYYDRNNRKSMKNNTLPAKGNLDLFKRSVIHPNCGSAENPHANSILEQQNNPLNKLSVHVNQQLNIPPVNVAAEDTESASDSGSLGPRDGDDEVSSDVDSAASDSSAPYSSSGFVESTESASSGIETSQYDTNSSVAAVSDDYEEEEEYEDTTEDDDNDDDDEDIDENASTESNINNSSLSTLTAATDEDDGEDEGEEEEEEDEDDEITIHAAASELALAQARWQSQFQMQYQFIANYVQNYMLTFRRQY